MWYTRDEVVRQWLTVAIGEYDGDDESMTAIVLGALAESNPDVDWSHIKLAGVPIFEKRERSM